MVLESSPFLGFFFAGAGLLIPGLLGCNFFIYILLLSFLGNTKCRTVKKLLYEISSGAPGPGTHKYGKKIIKNMLGKYPSFILFEVIKLK